MVLVLSIRFGAANKKNEWNAHDPCVSHSVDRYGRCYVALARSYAKDSHRAHNSSGFSS